MTRHTHTRLNLALARRSWDEFFRQRYGPLEPLVRRLIGLPSEQVIEEADPRPPLVLHTREGVVRGVRIKMLGYKADGRWADILEVQPV